jgi:2-desacetyl-2-hydroxyethyl bacteriochlorophyllide A dehydrogenase
MKRYFLECVAPGRMEVRCSPMTGPGEDEVTVQTTVSAISPGTEMLVYRGQWPEGVSLDSTIEALTGSFSYPVAYGYCAVGKVVELGAGVSSDWIDRRVFAFQPHQSHFHAPISSLEIVPDDIDDETALFLPGMETAITLMLDGRPIIGETVVVIGQGIIGLLTTAILCRFPLHSLITLERYPLRREASLRLGARDSFDPEEPGLFERLGAVVGGGGESDLVFELSGNPECLNDALALVRYTGRVVVGSWYGSKIGALDLGSFFHRGRITLISSQVSNLPPELSGRWNKRRRLETAWDMLATISPASLITHRFELQDGARAYAIIDRDLGASIQVIFDYRGGS